MNGVLIVDKPSGRTSHDAVRRARKALGTRAIGHAGTLDPMATGVLVLVLGEATKLSAYLTAEDKEYEAVIHLGVETDTLDADGSVVGTAPVPEGLMLQGVRAAADDFVGTRKQLAPRVSAIKVGGRPLHARVRSGESVEPPEREVTLHAVDRVELDEACISLRVHCSKGFYVRSFARDLAVSLGTVGHLARLRRTASGSFRVDQALGFEAIDAAAAGDEAARAQVRAHVLRVEDACTSMARVELTDAQCEDARCGRRIDLAACAVRAEDVGIDQPLALMTPRGEMIAIARRDGETLRVVRGICSTS